MADAGAYTKEQLRQFKQEAGIQSAQELRGRFEWMRHSLLAVVGGNFYYETPVIFRLNEWPDEIKFLRRFKRYGQAERLQAKLQTLRTLTMGDG